MVNPIVIENTYYIKKHLNIFNSKMSRNRYWPEELEELIVNLQDIKFNQNIDHLRNNFNKNELSRKMFNIFVYYKKPIISVDLFQNISVFFLKPEDHQPSGSCNLSKIDNCTLIIDHYDKNDYFLSSIND